MTKRRTISDPAVGLIDWLIPDYLELVGIGRENGAMQGEQMLIEPRAIGPFLKNGYILACLRTGQAAYIDPGDEAGELMNWVKEENLGLSCVLLTHGHMDHICGVGAVKRQWDIPVYLHPEDEFLYNALQQQAEWFGFSYAPPPRVDAYLEPDRSVTVGDLTIKVHHTPGHSPGSVTLEAAGHLFCGDLIFAGSVGRSDLPGGSHQVLIETVREKIFTLADDMIIHPGHGPSTTVGEEKRTNPFFAELPG